ncbi:MAG: FtsX-like permease family protein [Candidatus Hodarchaeota archaeon]
MGSFRVARKSAIFALRARKRLIVFVIIFGILSGATILLVGTFDSYNKQNLLEQRGVYILENSPNSITPTQAASIGGALASVLDEGKYDIHPVRYFDYPVGASSSMYVVGIDHGAPWAFSEIKPNTIQSGRFINGRDEAMVSEGFIAPLNWTEVGLSNMSASLKVGNSITFGASQGLQSFEVKGVFDRTPRMTSSWLVISNEAFDDLVALLGKTLVTDVSYFEIAFLASGGILEILFGDAYGTVADIAGELGRLAADTATYGDWTWVYDPEQEKAELRDRDMFSFVVGVVGGLIVATLYAYLITRFRRREVAILKAIGFNARNVRITLLAEILTVAFLGFAAATVVIEGYIRWTASSEYIASLFIMPYTTILISWGVVVLTCVPGFLLISWRILSVRPIEIFRER